MLDTYCMRNKYIFLSRISKSSTKPWSIYISASFPAVLFFFSFLLPTPSSAVNMLDLSMAHASVWKVFSLLVIFEGLSEMLASLWHHPYRPSTCVSVRCFWYISIIITAPCLSASWWVAQDHRLGLLCLTQFLLYAGYSVKIGGMKKGMNGWVWRCSLWA